VNFVDIVFASLLANNLLFFHFFGLGEFLGESGTVSLGRRIGVLAFLLLVSSAAYAAADHFILVPLHLPTLRTLLVFVILALVTSAYSAVLGTKGGPWPPAREFLVHSFLVGGVLLVGSSSADPFEVVATSVAVVLGYGGALVVMGAVFGRLSREKIPAFIQGLPLQLLTLGLVWLVLQGLGFAFSGKSS
jgi:Na+-translocating ferredoxin:NAD+ oxidoreductase RnfA subunit